ncbi:hypothetical protein, partial [Zwartia vadi]|uniref:hypothetical protein n=1 Tax=Zwartia vadi TaxID=3058168 RepID=UPI0025B2FB40
LLKGRYKQQKQLESYFIIAQANSTHEVIWTRSGLVRKKLPNAVNQISASTFGLLFLSNKAKIPL